MINNIFQALLAVSLTMSKELSRKIFTTMIVRDDFDALSLLIMFIAYMFIGIQ